jgi:hypothetical protein
MLEAHDRISRTIPVPLDLSGLPPVLAVLLKPWAGAVETCCLGMGDHVTAASANASASIMRRVIPMPPLERAIEKARIASDALASDLDRAHTLAVPARADAVAALTHLIVQLKKAKPNSSTLMLGLGW